MLHNLKKMNSLEEVYSNRWTAWLRKHSMALQVGGIILCNIVHLKEAGYTSEASTLSMILLGSASLYCFFKRQRKIKAQDLIVITGCNSGLGYSLAMHCRAKGAMVLAGVREVTPNFQSAVEMLMNKGIIVQRLDITNEQSVENFRDRVKNLLEERQLVLRAFINNAGVMVFGEFEWQTQNLAKYQVNVNLLGTMTITRQLMPILRENHSRIIVISSHCAAEPLPGISIYGATKAALDAWTTSLRVEVGKYGVEVISFIPGGFITESHIMKQQKVYFDEMKNQMSDETKRFYGNYFTRYVDYFSMDSSTESGTLKVLSNPRIYETFDNSLLDIYPSTFYRCEPWRYFFYRILFKTTPISIRDWLAQRFVVVPSWKDNN